MINRHVFDHQPLLSIMETQMAGLGAFHVNGHLSLENMAFSAPMSRILRLNGVTHLSLIRCTFCIETTEDFSQASLADTRPLTLRHLSIDGGSGLTCSVPPSVESVSIMNHSIHNICEFLRHVRSSVTLRHCTGANTLDVATWIKSNSLILDNVQGFHQLSALQGVKNLELYNIEFQGIGPDVEKLLCGKKMCTVAVGDCVKQLKIMDVGLVNLQSVQLPKLETLILSQGCQTSHVRNMPSLQVLILKGASRVEAVESLTLPSLHTIIAEEPIVPCAPWITFVSISDCL